MKNAEMNTARIETIASNRGMAVAAEPSSTARASGLPCSKWPWMFSIATVASSTRMPMASASPPRVIRLIVCPQSQRAIKAVIRASGMFSNTTKALRQSPRNRESSAPPRPPPSAFQRHAANGSRNVRRLIEFVTDADIGRQHGLHVGQRALCADHAQGRGVGPLGHQDIDRAPPITSA